MDTILKLHSENLKQLKSAIAHFGAATIHGDGNIYPHLPGWTPDSGKMNHSYNNATFSNDNRQEATYFKTYHNISDVPSSIDQLQTELIAERLSQAARQRAEGTVVASNVIPAWEEPVKKSTKTDEGQGSGSEKENAPEKAAKPAKSGKAADEGQGSGSEKA